MIVISKVIVITGAGSGLGRAISKRLASAGNTVVLLGRTAVKLEAVAAEAGEQASAVVCDVSSAVSVQAAFGEIAARFPNIDVLINNAVHLERALIEGATEEQIFATIGTNLIGAILCARAAIPMLYRGGQILNVSSGAADRVIPGLTLYSTSKAGLERFSLALFEELEPLDISVTFVRAGQMVERLGEWDSDPSLGEQLAAAAAIGLDPRQRPSTTFASAAEVFLTLIELPSDLRCPSIVLRARASSHGE